MKKLAYVLVVVSFLILVVALAGFFYKTKALEVHSFYANVEVRDGRTGFDINDSALTFGVLSEGASSRRHIVFTNAYDFPVIARSSVEGNIKNLLRFDEIVRLEKGETKKIPFVLTPSADDEGFYEGNVEIKVLVG